MHTHTTHGSITRNVFTVKILLATEPPIGPASPSKQFSYTADALYTLCRLPAGTAPSENQTHTNYFLSSRWRVCLRRYGLYFMSSTRWEVLRRFCDKWEEEDWGGASVSRVFHGWASGAGGREAGGSRGSRRVLRRA